MRFSILVGVLPCISHVFASTVPQAAAVLETQLDVIETLTGTIDGIVSSITNQTAGQSFGLFGELASSLIVAYQASTLTAQYAYIATGPIHDRNFESPLYDIYYAIAKSTVQLLKDFQSKQAAFAAIDASGQIIIILDEYQSGFDAFTNVFTTILPDYTKLNAKILKNVDNEFAIVVKALSA